MNDAIYYILEYFLFTGHERTRWNRKEEDESEEFAQSKKKPRLPQTAIA